MSALSCNQDSFKKHGRQNSLLRLYFEDISNLSGLSQRGAGTKAWKNIFYEICVDVSARIGDFVWEFHAFPVFFEK